MLIFAPDAQDIAPEILTAISGVPTMRGYKSPPGVYDYALSAVSATSLIQTAVVVGSNVQRMLVGTSSALYEFTGTAFTDYSRGGGYTAGEWAFCSFGGTVLAVNTTTKLQKATSGAFTDVTAPTAACMDSAGYFVMLGDCDDTGTGLSTTFGERVNSWWCSSYGDATSANAWTPSVITQCTTGMLADTPGAIRAIRAFGNDFIAYKRTSMYRGTYVGPPEVFRWELISNQIGCSSPKGVVKLENEHYFIGQDDIYRFDGSRPVPIGAGVREDFFSGFTKANLEAVKGRYDAASQRIYWHYRKTGAITTLDQVLVYHVPTGRFGSFALTVYDVFGGDNNAMQTGLTVDSTVARQSMAYIDGSKLIKSISEAGTALTMTTAWMGDEFKYSALRRVKPKFRTAPSAGTCTPSHCTHVNATPTTGSAANISSGRFDILQSARYHRFALSLTGDVEIEAIQPDFVVVGLE